MKRIFALVVFACAVLAPHLGAAAPGLDLLLVLDNSGSMKQNDPQFLTRSVVAEFVNSKKLPPDTRYPRT